MAAAEYYGGGPHQGPPMNTQFQPSPRPNPPQMGQLPYPISDEPPPYTPYADSPRPHSQPPPQQRPIGPGGPGHFTSQARPPFPPDKGSIQSMYRPSDFLQSPHPAPQQPHMQYQPPPQPQQPQQQQQHFYGGQPAQHAMSQVYGNGDGRRPSSTPAYPPRHRRDSRSRSRSRSRDRSRERSRSRNRRHHHHQQPRPIPASRKKSSGVSTFLGAGGGALIGDAIFPGLGTLSGAILGGVGGHEYSKQKRSYSSGAREHHRSYSDEQTYYDDRRGRKY